MLCVAGLAAFALVALVRSVPPAVDLCEPEQTTENVAHRDPIALDNGT